MIVLVLSVNMPKLLYWFNNLVKKFIIAGSGVSVLGA